MHQAGRAPEGRAGRDIDDLALGFDQRRHQVAHHQIGAAHINVHDFVPGIQVDLIHGHHLQPAVKGGIVNQSVDGTVRGNQFTTGFLQ